MRSLCKNLEIRLFPWSCLYLYGELSQIDINRNMNKKELNGPNSPHFSLPVEQSDEEAWEQVEPGRFMPRRVRGSCHGRALG